MRGWSQGILGSCMAVLVFVASVSGQTVTDSDNDGLPDAWESTFGLNPWSADSPHGATDDPDGDHLTNRQEFEAGSHPLGLHKRQLAEGADNAFFTWRMALANPNDTPAHLLITFERETGDVIRFPLTMRPRSRTTLHTSDVPGLTQTFSTQVESDVEIAVDRTMTWVGGFGSHSETAIATPGREWYLAEGATGGPFSLFYLIQNPGPDPATVTVTFLRPAPEPPIVRSWVVDGHTRKTLWVDELEPELANTDVAARFESDRDVVVERAMYADAPGIPFRAGHDAAAVAAPALEWFLAEGATGTFFDLFYLLANPSTTDAEIQVEYLLASGIAIPRSYVVPAQSRLTIHVDREHIWLADTSVSARVRSLNGVPIIVERSMWWGEGGWIEAHNSAGATTTGTRWVVADGEVGGPAQTLTYVLIANPTTRPGHARVTLFFEGGEPHVEQTFDLLPTSRFNVDVAAMFPAARNRRFAVLVESVGPEPTELVVEWSTYQSTGGAFWEAGTNALATNLSPPLLALSNMTVLRGSTTVLDTCRRRDGIPSATFSAVSSAPGVADVQIDASTGRMTVTGNAPGEATITVTAYVPGQAPTTETFTLRVGHGRPIAFAPPITIGSPLFPAVADMNRDGMPELVATVNDGHGRITQLDLRAIGLGHVADLLWFHREWRPADFNGDGILDIVGWSYLPITDPRSVARLFVGQPNGTYVEDPAFAALNVRGYGHSIVTADFDNDGDVDLFMPTYTYNDPQEQCYLLLNDGNGRFQEVADTAGVALRGWSEHWKAEGAQAVDFDGDGDLDLFVANHFFFNQGVVGGVPRFVDRRAELGLPLRFDEGIKFLDFDNDGLLDLVQHHPSEGPWLWRFDGTRFTHVPMPVFAHNGSFGMNVYDMNGDGYEDIVTAPGSFGTQTRIWVNVEGTFVRNPPTSLENDGGDALAFGDFDADGRIDIVKRSWLYAERYALNATPHPGPTLVLDIVGPSGERNQYGRVARIRPRQAPHITYTRVVDGGSGYLSANQYELIVPTPYTGEFDVTVRFADGERSFVVSAGSRVRLFSDGRMQPY